MNHDIATGLLAYLSTFAFFVRFKILCELFFQRSSSDSNNNTPLLLFYFSISGGAERLWAGIYVHYFGK